MRPKSPRLAVRGIVVHENRLLLVNAWPGNKSPLLCAPGGGVEPGSSLPENLAREIHEETGLRVQVGAPCLVNEFHDPTSGFHQVEVFFRCAILGDAQIDPDWKDPEDIVNRHIWIRPDQLADAFLKPNSLKAIAFVSDVSVTYDALETIVM